MPDNLNRIEETSEKSSLNLKSGKSEKVPRAIREQIITTIFRHISPETTTVFLFGSLAENTDMKYSDIDIGIIGQDKISDSVFLSLCDELNYTTDTLRKIDLVDFDRVDNSFREFALGNIKIWHTAGNLKEKSQTWKKRFQTCTRVSFLIMNFKSKPKW